MSLEVIEVCSIANLQTLGPVYIGDTNRGIFNSNTGNLLAARLIITAGMGSSGSPTMKLHGPVPIPELELEEEYHGYFLIEDLVQKPIPGSNFSTGKGTHITCIIIPANKKKEFRAFEQQVENIIRNNVMDLDFGETVTGTISEEVRQQIIKRLHTIQNDISEAFKLSELFEGNSLFDIGLIASLPENIAKIVKKLILHPKGLPIDDIDDKNILKTLEQAGLVEIENRDGLKWIVPR